MSSDIWTRCAGASRTRALALEPLRVVEAQHVVATRKLVDSAEEQALLEDLIDRAKPPSPTGGEARLHYLLATPFRYPPLRHGSRLGRRHERGIFYASLTLDTVFAEAAFYRLVFLEGTEAELRRIRVELTSFRAEVSTPHGLDLCAAPFDACADEIASPVDYRASQLLGSAMREAGVEACLYPSARDPERGANVAVFSAAAFARPEPFDATTWHCVATRARVVFVRRDPLRSRREFVYEREVFEVDKRLPYPPP